jgi:hypothetical protein
MKNFNKYFFLSLLAFGILVNQGCDILNNYFLNLPLKQGITAKGTNITIANSETVYLSDYDAYADNIDNIKSIEYVAAIYRTLLRGENPTPPPDSLNLTRGLVGNNIEVRVTDGDGNLLFIRNTPTAAADDYIASPDTISLEPTEISLINEYLAAFKDENKRETLSFTGTITMDGIPPPPAGEENVLTGQVEILLKLELEP